MASGEEVLSLRQAWRLAWRLCLMARPHWKGILQVTWLSLAIGAVALATPILTKAFIDDVFPARNTSLMHLLVLAMLAFTITSAIVGGIRTYCGQLVSAKLSMAMNLLFFNHVQHLPARFFDEHRVGEVTSRIGEARGVISTLANMVQMVLLNGMYLLLVPPVLLVMSAPLAFIALAPFLATSLISAATGRVRRKYWKRSSEAAADLNALQVEAMTQVRTLKVLATERVIYRRAEEQSQRALETQLRAGVWSAAVALANGSVRALGTAAFTWFAWSLILRGDFTIGGFVAFTAYLGYLTGPVGQLTGLMSSFQQTAVALGRVFEYLDTRPEQDPSVVLSPPAAPRHVLRGNITFTNVSFGYPDRELALRNVSFAVDAGSVTSVVGPSGAGKSTLLRLLVRLVDPGNGQVLLDGVPSTRISLRDLRRQIAVVWQEVSLLKGTLWDNLTIGLEEVSVHAVEEVLWRCRLNGLVSELPSGLHSAIAEWGSSLSGGQRQRVAIARALLRNAPILLLDEATSQIDQELEREILAELLARRGNTTILYVTHRISTARLADRILVLDGGHLVATGTHDELAASPGPYRKMLDAARESPVGVHEARHAPSFRVVSGVGP